MSLGDIFKKSRPKKEKVEKKKEEAKAEAKPVVETPKIKKEVKPGEAYRILKTPHVTEKATDLVKKNQYVFNIYPKTNKVEIKKTIEDLYGVEVRAVKIVNIPPKKRKLGKTKGWRAGYKKAIVRVKEGQKIEVLPR